MADHIAVSEDTRECRFRCPAAVLFLVVLAFTHTAWANAVDDLTPGHWYKVPHSKLMQVAPKPRPPGDVGPKAVVSAWSGGAFDTRRHRMIVWGGGHADYSGNEVYVFDVNSLKWQRLTEPSRDVGGNIKTGLYPDGRPRSAHSYNSLQYLPNVDQLVVLGLTATYRTSGRSNKLFAFDFSTLKWHHDRSPMPNGTVGYDSVSAYDSKTGLVWVHGSMMGGLYSYNPLHDKWNGPYSRSYLTIYPTAAIDPAKNLMVAVGGGAYKPPSQAVLWRLDDPGKRIDLGKMTSGPKKIEGAKAPGFVFDPEIQMFVGWDGGGDVYLLDPSNWRWHRIEPSAGNPVVPPEPSSNGTYGRFRYVPSKNAFILVNGADQDVYFYKLPADLSAAERPEQEAAQSSPATSAVVATASEHEPVESQVAGSVAMHGDVTNFAVVSESGHAQQDVPVTFGQVFKSGQVGANGELEARLTNGRDVPLQVDRKTTNADGSLRFAVLTTILPHLKARAVERLGLVSNTDHHSKIATHDDVTLNDLVNSHFDAKVSVEYQGHTYTLSAIQALNQEGGKPSKWLSGPLATEWVARGLLTDSQGRVQPNLGVEFYIRAYRGLKHVRVGVALDNDWSYAVPPTNMTYDVSISVGDKIVYKRTSLTQYAHTRWHSVFWWGQTTPSRAIWLNTAYIQGTGAVPQYEELSPSTKALNGLLSRWEPMEHGSIAKYMPATGANPDIGLLPRWSALYLVSGDLRAQRAVILNGEAGGSYSVHYQTRQTWAPLSIKNHPYVSIIANPGDMTDPKTGQSQALPKCSGDCRSPYKAEYAHMPSVAYLPYLITGDYYFLQELEQWANWHEIWMNPDYRKYSQGMLFPHGQLRGQSWSLRELAYAAYIAPDADPMKSYFHRIVENNLDYLRLTYADNSQANRLHFVSDWGAVIYNGKRGIAPWQQDFFNSVLDQLMRTGFHQARPILKWFSKFPVGRMTAPGYCWISGAVYSLNVRDEEHAPFYSTFKQAYDNSVPKAAQRAPCNSVAMAKALHLKHKGEMAGYAYEPTGFPSNMQPALAAAVDAGADGADQAWKLFMSRGIKPNYANYPNFAIVPGSVKH